MVVLGVTGLRGGGKGVVGEVAAKLGFVSLEMSSVVMEMMKEEGAPINNRSIREWSSDAREKWGADFVARKIVEKVPGGKNVVILGIRSPAEIETFWKEWGSGYKTLAVFAPKEIRFERVRERGRKGDPDRYAEFAWADEHELAWGLGSAMALADEMVVNEGSKKEFESAVERLLSKLAKS